MSYHGHLLRVGSYTSVEMQSVYSTAPTDWAKLWNMWFTVIPIIVRSLGTTTEEPAGIGDLRKDLDLTSQHCWDRQNTEKSWRSKETYCYFSKFPKNITNNIVKSWIVFKFRMQQKYLPYFKLPPKENRYCYGLKIQSGTASFRRTMKWARKTLCLAITDSPVKEF